MDAGSEPRRGERELASLGLLALLPLAALAWPFAGSPVATALEPELAGAAVLALGALPAILVIALARRGPAALGLFPLVAYAAACLASTRLAPPTDALEADRATLLVAGGLALAVAGACTGPRAREIFARELPWLALVLLVVALADERELRGVLGNTGATSEAALPGALAGAWAFAAGRGLSRAVGLAALVGHAAYAGLAPVLAGIVSLGVALLAAVLAARAARRRLALAAAIALVAFGAARAFGALREEAATPAGVEAPSHTGGVAVRLAIARALPSFVRDHGALGAGPGQFRAAFPPYRDAGEIARARRAQGTESEVEHAHDDWLQGFCDAGWLGGACWVAFLAWTSFLALRALGDPSRGALALVALGLAANAALRAPLLWNAASAASFFFAAGALAGRDRAPTRAARIVPWLVLALLAALATRALSILRLAHELDRSRPAVDVARALEIRADSTLAWTLSARELERRGAHDAARRAWQRVLELRPFQVEARVQVGWNSLVLGDADEAARAWRRALAIDPTHPAAARNLYVLALRGSDRAELDRALERARATLASAEPVELAANATLAGRDLGLAALRALIPDLAGKDGVELEEPARSLAASGQRKLADALECRLAQVSAREFAAGGAWHDAVRLYRQALRLARTHGEDAGAPLRLELAAALAEDGDLDAARRELGSASWSAAELASSPQWARDALAERGLLAR